MNMPELTAEQKRKLKDDQFIRNMEYWLALPRPQGWFVSPKKAEWIPPPPRAKEIPGPVVLNDLTFYKMSTISGQAALRCSGYDPLVRRCYDERGNVVDHNEYRVGYDYVTRRQFDERGRVRTNPDPDVDTPPPRIIGYARIDIYEDERLRSYLHTYARLCRERAHG